MFSPSLFCETSAYLFCSSCSTTTMASADLSACIARMHGDLPRRCGERSRTIRAFSFCLFLPDLPERVLLYLWGFAKVCLLTLPFQPHIRFLFVSTDICSKGIPLGQSRFLHSCRRRQRACGLLILRGLTPAYKDLSPSGKTTQHTLRLSVEKLLKI